MSDYLFMLESHLTPAQREAVVTVEAVAKETDCQVFLVGGAMRDMLGGFAIGDLDFAVQGNALALAKALTRSAGAEMTDSDTHRRTAELRFPSGVTAEIGMARIEQYSKAGGRPVVKPAPIHDDLLRRDFTVNSIALSLHPASRGLLLDPANGLSDIERREIRANSNYSLYDDPVRILRLVRLKVRLGFTVHERTQAQYENVREAEIEKGIPPRALFQELRAIANEASPAQVIAELDREKLLYLFSPALHGAKLNLGALGKLEKAKQMAPYGANLNLENLGLFLWVLTEKLTPKEKSDLAKALAMTRPEIELWQKLEARSRSLEKDLKSKKLHRSSEVYRRLRAAPGDQLLFLYLHSKERIVHDRIRNFLQKYLPAAMEVTDRDVVQMAGIEPAHPKFPAVKEQIIMDRLDGRKFTPPKGLGPAAESSGEEAEAAKAKAASTKKAKRNHRSARPGTKQDSGRKSPAKAPGGRHTEKSRKAAAR